jgi:hypothetical protein
VKDMVEIEISPRIDKLLSARARLAGHRGRRVVFERAIVRALSKAGDDRRLGPKPKLAGGRVWTRKSVSVRPDTYELLQQLAKAKGISLSALVQSFVDEVAPPRIKASDIEVQP